VILISIDGYRYDYTSLYHPPSLTNFKSEGSFAKALIPVYPSKTFTNHYSIATGLFSENHGIVSNSFYDPLRKAEYKLSNRQAVGDGSWYNGTPIWVAAEQQGMLAATYFWPGSEAKIQGLRPSYFFEYDEKTPIEDRISQVTKWLSLPPEKRPHLITLYFADVDSAGHKFGPNSKNVHDAIMTIDQAIGHLLEQIHKLALPINVMIVSDHGMQELNNQDIEYLDDYIDLQGIRLAGDGIQLSLYFNDPVQLTHAYSVLKTKAKHFQIFKREEMPARYHYSKSPRCGDLIIVTESPYFLGLRAKSTPLMQGGHGYDPDLNSNMQGIFYAQGPQIRSHLIFEAFRNIHIYPLIMQLLDLKISWPIDGDASVTRPLLIQNVVTGN
jgi:predicted AlkP superfamily pyrophosphatase or phosphodiesterase